MGSGFNLNNIMTILNKNSITGNIKEDCVPYLWRKILIFFIVFLVTWNASKIPYYIGFDANGDTPYEKAGLAGSINLAFWLKGYQGSKLHSPACNFLLVHIAFGSTVLIMMVLALVNGSWRKKYGMYFFTFSILLGVHTIPAAVTTNSIPLRIIFTITCIYVAITGLFGYRTLYHYDKDPVKAEKHLLWEYGIITFGAYGAGFAEFSGIYEKIVYRLKEGVYFDYGPSPDPKFGHGLYDLLPEKYGLTFFFLFVTVFWIWWPIKLIKIQPQDEAALVVENETTMKKNNEQDNESITLTESSALLNIS